MKADFYGLIANAVEQGFEFGWNRAHKHTDNPGKDAIFSHVEQEIMNAVCRYIVFDDLHKEER